MDTIFGLKPQELAAIIFGIFGMIFGLAAYNRAKRSEALSLESNERAKRAEERLNENDMQSRELAFSQRKAEALKLLTEGESALMAARRRQLALRNAASDAGATDIIKVAEQQAANYEADLITLKELRAEAESMTSIGKSHEEIVFMTEKTIPSIERLFDPKLISEQLGSLMDQAEHDIRIFTIHREVVDALKKQR
jgi:hypothetical protein